MSKYQIALIASAAIAALTIAPANAEEKKYTAEMTATAQVPPVESEATGTAELTWTPTLIRFPGKWRSRG